MNGKELIETLEDAGLSPYQADAYVTLLELGSASATDIAATSTVPDPRIYDVLRDLAEEGYIDIYEDDSLHARALDPAHALTSLRSRASRLERAAAAIEDRWTRPDVEPHTVQVASRIDTVLTKAIELIGAAQRQVQVGLTPAQFDRFADVLETAHDDGVYVRLCLVPELDEEPTLPSSTDLARCCDEARYRDVPSPFVALVDRSRTCFGPHQRSTNEYGVVVTDRSHAFVFNWFFLTCLWEGYETIYDGTDDSQLTYVDLRCCLREITPFVENGAAVEATVWGVETDTRRERTIHGTVTEVQADGALAGPAARILPTVRSGRASLTLETDEGTVTVGGWGAMLEDVEATTVRIDSIE